MALELEQIKSILENPRNRSKIPSMVEHEDRLKFHTERVLNRNQSSAAINEFLRFVRALIPSDKFAYFLTLLRFPVDTVSLTSEVYQALEKVFDGCDPVYHYEFLSDEDANDWQVYRSKKLDEPNFWKKKAFQTMQTAINSVMVVDLPKEQIGSKPEPYMYFVPISNVSDYETINDTTIDWIMFEHSKGHMAVYDDENYRVFKMEGRKIESIVVDEPHNLGYCPAQFFWGDSLSIENPDLKASVITNQLSQLDWILFYIISKKYSDLYAPWTIYWGYMQDCSYSEKDTGHSCDSGYLVDTHGDYIVSKGKQLSQCPKCAKNIAGVGSFIDVPPPTENQPSLIPPAGKIDVDVGALNYNVAELERLMSTFYKNVTGSSLEAVNDQAINEKQVMSLFESRKQAIMSLKGNFENAQQWANKTECKLRYGDSFVFASVNYGTEWYLFSAEDSLNLYTAALEADMDHIVLDMLQDQYFETKYRFNNVELQTVKTRLNVDPFRHLTRDQVKIMYTDGHISYEDYYLKMNYSSLVMKFEREQGPIGEYLRFVPFNQKVDMVKAILYSYIENPIPSEDNDLRDAILNYGGAVRSGAITPQKSDEEYFRAALGAPKMGNEAIQAWKDDKGVRRPTTIVSKAEGDAALQVAKEQ